MDGHDCRESAHHDLEVLQELTYSLASNLDFRDILLAAVERIASLSGIAHTAIVMLRDGTESSYVVAAADDPGVGDTPLQLTYDKELREVLSTGNRIVREPDTATGLGLAFIPVRFERRVLGVLVLRADTVSFLPVTLTICSAMASAIATALRNARVLKSLRDQTRQVNVARFEAEREVRSLQKYADFFESAADGAVVIDSEGVLLFSNPKAREITGYTEEKLATLSLGQVIVREDLTKARRLLAGFAQAHYPSGVDLVITGEGGRRVILSVNFNPVLRDEGAILCSFRDVTRERAVAAELSKTQTFLQRVIDSSFDAIISTDMRGQVLLFNHAAERIFGRTTEEMIGRTVDELYPAGMKDPLMEMIYAGNGRIDDFKTEVQNDREDRVPVSISAALLYEDEAPVGTVWLLTDLREKMHMEHRLQQAQEQLLAQERQAALAELAGAAAHELNQPLTSVMGYAELLRKQLKRDASSAHAAEVIYTEAERMADIVRRIGKITKYETKAYVGRTRILDLNRSADENAGDTAAQGVEVKP